MEAGQGRSTQDSDHEHFQRRALPGPDSAGRRGNSKPQAQAAASDNGGYQPPPKAPLPPGQGTRVDQLV